MKTTTVRLALLAASIVSCGAPPADSQAEPASTGEISSPLRSPPIIWGPPLAPASYTIGPTAGALKVTDGVGNTILLQAMTVSIEAGEPSWFVPGATSNLGGKL